MRHLIWANKSIGLFFSSWKHNLVCRIRPGFTSHFCIWRSSKEHFKFDHNIIGVKVFRFVLQFFRPVYRMKYKFFQSKWDKKHCKKSRNLKIAITVFSFKFMCSPPVSQCYVSKLVFYTGRWNFNVFQFKVGQSLRFQLINFYTNFVFLSESELLLPLVNRGFKKSLIDE